MSFNQSLMSEFIYTWTQEGVLAAQITQWTNHSSVGLT